MWRSAAIALAEDYQWADAAEHFAASMSGPHVPGHARRIYASLCLRGLGRFEESAAEMRRAAEQDPLNATRQAIWAAHLIDANRVDEAMTAEFVKWISVLRYDPKAAGR